MCVPQKLNNVFGNHASIKAMRIYASTPISKRTRVGIAALKNGLEDVDFSPYNPPSSAAPPSLADLSGSSTPTHTAMPPPLSCV